MKYLYIVLLTWSAISCSNKSTAPVTERYNVLDSLLTIEGLNTLETRVFQGGLTDEGGLIRHTSLTIYNYKNSGNGVFILTEQKTLESTGKNSDHTFGRLYTLRGDATNPDAVVYQLVTFKNKMIMNLLYKNDKLIRLDNNFFPPTNKANNTLLLF